MGDAFGGFPILTAIIAAPAIGALVVFLIPAGRVEAARAVGYASTAATLGLSLWMLWHFQTGRAGYQFVESERWMGSIGVKYVVGVDGISLFMIVLTALLFPIGLLASAKLTNRVKAFTAWMLLLEAALLGVFLALDLIVFFVFFEVVLVPMYFIILGWGHDRRNYAALKFFLYTMAGSAFLLVGLLALGFLHQSATGHLTFDLRTLTAWAPGGLDEGTAKWLFLAFFAAFAVKVPLFPLHTWLPDAHTEAPTAGSVILAGVLLKMGTYGFLRFSLALLPAGLGRPRAPAPRAGHRRHHLRRDRRQHATEPETVGRVLVGRAPRLRRGRHLRPHHTGHRGRHLHDDQPRAHHRCTLPPRRDALRPQAHVRHRFVRWSVEVGADPRRIVLRHRVPRRSDCPASPASSASSWCSSARSSSTSRTR